MLTVFLCDDDKDTINKYSNRLDQIAQKHQIQVSISAYYSGESLIFNLSESPNSADIIYLDILMGGINGIETAKRLRECGCRAEIIFLTTSEDYVFDAFDISPVHYLLKDDTATEKFEQVFLRAVSMIKDKSAEMFVCASGNSRKVIPIKDISYFEIWKRIATVHCQTEQPFEFYMSMKELGKKLIEKHFVRVHRSYLVNLRYITKFKTQSLLLKTGEEIPIGITYAESVKEAFSRYVTQFNIV